MSEKYTDYDSPWKEMLERYFEEFMAFFFPKAYRGIDWSKGYNFLDKELQQIVRDAELGRRLVDKLVSVFRKKSRTETWVLVHVEVQGQPEEQFDKRMYVYNYRLFDRYDRPVCSLAVLADEQEDWRPKKFRYALWGCTVSLTFPVVKLLDYQKREQELENSSNPFAIVVLAYLKTRATRKNFDDRFQWKLRLFKMLYERGYSKEDILELTRFIDWIMVLPEELEQRFDDAITQFEEERKMQYVTSFERRGIEKGIEQGIQKGLQQGLRLGILETSREAVIDILRARFESVPRSVVASVNELDDLSFLKDLLKKAATIASFQEFHQLLERESVTELPEISEAICAGDHPQGEVEQSA